MRRDVANSFLSIHKVNYVVALCISYFEFVDQTLWDDPFKFNLFNPTFTRPLSHCTPVLYLLVNSKLRVCSSIPMV